MKHILFCMVLISLFLFSCTPTDILIEKNDVSDPVVIMNMISEKDINYNDMVFFEADSFKQLLRIGDGSLHIMDFNELYPFFKKDSKYVSIYTLKKAREYDSFIFKGSMLPKIYRIDEASNNNQDTQSIEPHQPNYPIAFFNIKNDEDPMISHTFFLRYVNITPEKTEIWLLCESLEFDYKIADITSPGKPSLPKSYYNKPFDYFNDWLVYTQEDDIFLINLYAELYLMATEGEVQKLHGLKKNLQQKLPISIETYQDQKDNRTISGIWDTAFKPRNRGEWKRMLHLYTLDNYLLLSFPTQQDTELIYLFDHQFMSPPAFIEVKHSQYRLYRGSESANDGPKILMYDVYLDMIEIYDLDSKHTFKLDPDAFLSQTDRAVNNAFLYHQGERLYLLLFTVEFMQNQNPSFIAIELDEQMKVESKHRISLESNALYRHVQVLHRIYENDLALLSIDKETNQTVLFCIDLENLTDKVEYAYYRLPFYHQIETKDLMMLYSPGGYFTLQVRSNIYQENRGNNFYDLNAIQKSEPDPQVTDDLN